MNRNYDVAAYIWPSYHYEPRVEHFWPEKDGEWYTVRRGTPRFPGHDMPRIPLLGWQDEADPKVMRQHVELALAHGVNVFIMDWYWYENAPCFERQLNEGLIPALEGTDAKFYLMWANHDVDTLWNMHEDTDWSKPRPVLWSGQVSRTVLEPMFERIIGKYFALDSYYRIAGKPVFSIFDYPNLIGGLGGVEQTADAFAWMRRRCVERGLSGLDLQAIGRMRAGVEAGAKLAPGSEAAAARALGFDSATAYQSCMEGGQSGDYVVWANQAINSWPTYEAMHGTYYPHASIGWDNTHRNPSFAQESVVVNATPDAFEACLWKAKAWLDARPNQVPLVTINSWNEWTEGSYLLPDMRWGYGYLRAVRNVFGGGGALMETQTGPHCTMPSAIADDRGRGGRIIACAAAAWHSQQLEEPCILENPKDPTRLLMFYSGVPSANTSVCHIGKAWALKSDPFSWHQDPGNPVFSQAARGWDSASIRLDCVLYVQEEDAYYIYYSGTDVADAQNRIGLAICPAGEDGYSGISAASIQRHGSAPVLAPEPDEPFAETMASQAAVGRERDTAGIWRWYLYYSYRGRNGVLPGIRLATSIDGKTWQRQYNADDPRGMGHLFVSTPDAYYEWHQVFKVADTYVLSMEVGPNRGERWRTVLAVSRHPDRGWEQLDVDTVLQTRWPGIYSDDTMFHVATPAFYRIGDRWYLYTQACPLPTTKNYIDGRWDLWAFACDRRIPTRPGLADLFIPGLPDSAPAKEPR